MTTRVVIITGANSGTGFESARCLAKWGYEVIMACRSDERAQQAMDKIKQEQLDAKVSYHQLDLADFGSVDAFADWFLSTDKPLYALLNNGGILLGEGDREVNKDGLELNFVVNHLGHFLLTLRLLDKLKSSVAEYGETRIVNVASGWHSADACNSSSWTTFEVKPLDMEDINLEKPGSYHYLQAYKNSKAAQILFTKALGKTLTGTGVTINSCCPGQIPSTNVFRHMSWTKKIFLWVADNWLTRWYFDTKTVEQGAATLVGLVDDSKFEGKSGLFVRDGEEKNASDEVCNEENQKTMWKLSCEMIKRPEFQQILVG